MFALLLVTSCAKERAPLALGFTLGDPNPAIARAIVEVLESNGIRTELAKEFESMEELSAAVEGGAIDAGIIGEPLTPNSNLSMLMPLLPRVLHVLHHKSMGSPSLNELLSASSIYAGPENSMSRAIFSALAAHHHVTGVDSRLLDLPWAPVADGPLQVYFTFGGLLSIEAREGFADYEVFSFNESTASSPDALALLYPNLRVFQLPAGIYPGLTSKQIETLAVETLLVVRPAFDDELAYELNQILREQSQPLETVYALSRGSLDAPMEDTVHTLAIHSGSRRYIDKDAPSLLERYAEVFALIATVALGLGTILTGWVRYTRQRRKDRLDGYFLRLHELRDTLHVAGATPHRPEEVAEMEADVLQLLVEERLAVDSALVSFFLMSESVRREIKSANKKH